MKIARVTYTLDCNLEEESNLVEALEEFFAGYSVGLYRPVPLETKIVGIPDDSDEAQFFQEDLTLL
jgi:hypothetical protein